MADNQINLDKQSSIIRKHNENSSIQNNNQQNRARDDSSKAAMKPPVVSNFQASPRDRDGGKGAAPVSRTVSDPGNKIQSNTPRTISDPGTKSQTVIILKADKNPKSTTPSSAIKESREPSVQNDKRSKPCPVSGQPNTASSSSSSSNDRIQTTPAKKDDNSSRASLTPDHTKPNFESSSSKQPVATAVVVAQTTNEKSTPSSQPSEPSSLILAHSALPLTSYDNGEFCQNCLDWGHCSVDCPSPECGICFEMFATSARRVAHTFLKHRDVVNSEEYCQPISSRVQQLSDSDGLGLGSSLVRSDGLSNKRSRDASGIDSGDDYFNEPKRQKQSKSELEGIIMVLREQMKVMKEEMKTQRKELQDYQWEVLEHRKEMKRDREEAHAQRQVMKQQQELIDRQQGETRQVVKLFTEESAFITKKLADLVERLKK